MKEVDEFLQLLLDNSESDNRISIDKKMKYGFRHYFITLSIDEQTESNSSQSYYFKDSLEFHFDSRNSCIEISDHENSIVIEDKDLLDRWSRIIEEKINTNIKEKVKEKIEKSLNTCVDKSLLRQYQMRKLFE